MWKLKSKKNKLSTVIWHNIIVLVIGLCLTSCEEIIDIEPDQNNAKILVVEGGITNEPPPYEISLKTADDITGIGQNTLGIGATLTLIDKNGSSEVLTESTPGNYQTTDGLINGQVGGSYQLHIELKNGEQYQSDYDLMPDPVVVDDVYEELVKEPILNSQLTEIGQTIFHKIYTNIKNDNSRKLYIKSTQKKSIIEREVGLGTGCEDFGPPKCYAISEVNIAEIYLVSNLQIESDSINLEIATVPIEFKGLYYTSFAIESISMLAFDYYDAIKQQLATAGTIFDPLIPKVPTNIHGINGTERIAQGYFRAYAVTTAEICYDRANVELRINIPFACDYCWNVFDPATKDLPPEMQNCR